MARFGEQFLKARVFIRVPTPADRAAFFNAVRRSRAFHGRWVRAPATPQAYRDYLKRISSESHRGFLVLRRDNRDLVGVVNLNNIVRGAFQSAALGYYAFSRHAGQGLMREGLQLVLARAFRKLKLHRLEANVQPANRASLALVRSRGFVCEGYSRRFLKVAGRWRDHERWALLAENWRRAARGSRASGSVGTIRSRPLANSRPSGPYSRHASGTRVGTTFRRGLPGGRARERSAP